MINCKMYQILNKININNKKLNNIAKVKNIKRRKEEKK